MSFGGAPSKKPASGSQRTGTSGVGSTRSPSGSAAPNRNSPGSAGSNRNPPNSGSGSVARSKGLAASKSSPNISSSTTPKGRGKPSDRLNPKTVDPFTAASKSMSPFATIYSTGSIPCRLIHGSVKHKLAWNPAPEDVNFDPTLVTLAEGLRETIHPYMFVARQGFSELLALADAGDRATPLVARLVPPLRAALSHADSGVFQAGLEALLHLSHAVGPALNPHMKTLLPMIAKKAMDKKHREHIMIALQDLEVCGGKEASLLIKARIPTFTSLSNLSS